MRAFLWESIGQIVNELAGLVAVYISNFVCLWKAELLAWLFIYLLTLTVAE